MALWGSIRRPDPVTAGPHDHEIVSDKLGHDISKASQSCKLAAVAKEANRSSAKVSTFKTSRKFQRACGTQHQEVWCG